MDRQMSPSTQRATSQLAEPHSPWIPPELVYIILGYLWDAEPAESNTRATLLKNIVLVNRTWLALAARIVSRDAHPSCYHDRKAFIRLIGQPLSTEQPHSLFSTEVNRLANETCRSITLHADGRLPSASFVDDGKIGVGLAIRLASLPNRLPNLRHIAITHTDWAHSHIFQHIRAWGFPPQVTHLSLTYAFTQASRGHVNPLSVDNALMLTWIPDYSGGRKPASAPGIRYLAVSGVPTPLPGLLLRNVCTNVETLELTRPAPAQIPDLVPLPPAVRTLVLRYPGTPVSKKEMAAWLLPSVLKREIFPRASNSEGADVDVKRPPPRIVVRSGTPDPVLFIELWRECRKFDVELVYERDESKDPAPPPDARPEALNAYVDGPSPSLRQWLPFWKQGRDVPREYM